MSNWKERIQGKQEGRTFGDTIAPLSVDMSAEECKKLCDKIGKEYKSGYKDRILKYVTTNESTDRYGDIVRVAGADLTNYKKNPVVMFSHQHDNFPVGAAIDINIDTISKNIPALALFLDDRVDTTGRSDLVFKFAKSKFLPACSIGFLPSEGGTNRPTTKEERMKIGLGEHGVEYKKWEYLEFSPCGIPANPEALQNVLKTCDFSQVHFEQRDFDSIEKASLLEANLLDMFSSFIIDTNKTTIDLSKNNLMLEDRIDNPSSIISIPIETDVNASDFNIKVCDSKEKEQVEINVSINYKEVLKKMETEFTNVITLLENRIDKMKKDLEIIKDFNYDHDSSSQRASESENKEALDIYEKVLSGGLEIKL